jgi:spermidine synthase
MLPRITLATALVPGTGDTLRLVQRGDDFMIFAGSVELMASRMTGSEQALAALAIDAMAPRRAPRLLIGGLGMGFTLRAALERLPTDAAVTVAELVPQVAEWARGPLAALHGTSLNDPRVTLVIGDVAEAMARGPWDSILLDVDNGPDALTHPANGALYSPAGLAAARAALAPGGCLALWSAHPSPAFEARLAAAGFAVTTHRPRAANGKGARHIVWIARG